jgi:hypothetical protein
MIIDLLKKRISPLIGISVVSFLLILVLVFTFLQWRELEIKVRGFSKVSLGGKLKETDSSVFLPEGFSDDLKKEFIEDVNGDGRDDLILTSTNNNNTGCLVVAIFKDDSFEKIGEFMYEEAYRGVLSVIDLEDIDRDGEKEIFLSLASGGASTEAEGILDIDFLNKEINWVMKKDESGEISKSLFYKGAAVTHHHLYEIKDIDKDNNKEIMTVDSWFEQEEPSDLEDWEFSYLVNLNPSKEWRKCGLKIFEWDGEFFSYSKELVSQIEKSDFREICVP